jgi:putative hemolysin
MGSELLIILALVLVNAVFAGAEIAVLSVRRTRLTELMEGGSGAARAVQALRAQPERFLATVQIGITVVGATAGAFGGATLAADLAPVLAGWVPLAPYAGTVALAVVVTVVSFLSLVVGELVPKSLALKAAEPYALAVGRPLLWLSRLLRPLAWVLTAASNLILFPFRDRTSFIEARLSPDELMELVDEAASAGTVNPRAGEIAARALRLPSLTAGEVMIPRTQVVALRKGAPPEELRRVLLEHTHSRFPVVQGDLDHVVGYVTVKDVLVMAWEERLFVLEDLLRPVYFVPEAKSAMDLLTELRTRRVPFAVVVDERGGMAGLITLEDLLEELVGEIFSEHARPVPELFHRAPDGTITVLGTVALRDVIRELKLDLPQGDWTTVAGLCLALAGRIPTVGTRLPTPGGVVLEVVDASARRVRAVRLHLPAVSAPRPAGE